MLVEVPENLMSAALVREVISAMMRQSPLPLRAQLCDALIDRRKDTPKVHPGTYNQPNPPPGVWEVWTVPVDQYAFDEFIG